MTTSPPAPVRASALLEADALRERMVDEIVAFGSEGGATLAGELEAAMRRVPRHLFLPGVALDEAYGVEDAVVTARDEAGVAISSVSAPRIVALMLKQLNVRSGHRVLEIGSGYNTALLAELVGPNGHVTTVDIDPDVVERTRRGLAATGHTNVTVLCADGEYGAPDQAVFDRMEVTAEAPDIPPAWWQQLADDGRLVAPLRMHCLTRSVAFERDADRLVGRNYELCGFVPMRGDGSNRERTIALHGNLVRLRLDDDRHLDPAALTDALTQQRHEAWSGVTLGPNERFDGLHLWLAMGFPEFCMLAATQEALDRGLVASKWSIGAPALVEGDSFAYMALRPTTPERKQFEFGGYGHGPNAPALVARMMQRMRTWDGTSLRASIEVHPADTPDSQLPAGAWVIDKRHTRVTVCWP